jgi:putative SOS response-associated peptidase YedK
LGLSYNVAPTDEVYGVTAEGEGRALRTFSWGLVPGDAVDPARSSRPINARAETLVQRPTFKGSFLTRRCLIPADGFYEWETSPTGTKQPYFFRSLDGYPLAIAGLWDAWEDPSHAKPAFSTCAMVTTRAAEPVSRLHDRMPLILGGGEWARWLDPGADVARLKALLVPPAEATLAVQAVSKRVNDVRNNDPSLIEEVAVEAPAGQLPLL